MRACLLATWLARIQGLPEPEAAVVYATTLLRFVGCTATSLEYAQAFGGDDVRVRGRGDQVDPTMPGRSARAALGARRRLLPARTSPPGGPRSAPGQAGDRRGCTRPTARSRPPWPDGSALTGRSRRRCGRSSNAGTAAAGPHGLGGEQIATGRALRRRSPTRAVLFADLGPDTAVVADPRGGRDGSSTLTLSPGVREPPGVELLEDLERTEDLHLAVVAAEPGLRRSVTEDAARPGRRAAFADVVDLKSPYTARPLLGRGRAGRGGRRRHLGLPARRSVAAVRRAGLFHDLGRAGVPTRLWDKPGPLSRSEWERVRLHPYHTERILADGRRCWPARRGSPAAHHERLDGSGYHRGTSGPAAHRLDARVLGRRRRLPGPDRATAPTARPTPPAEAARTLAGRGAAWRLDRRRSRRSSAAAGHRTRPGRARAGPAGLSDREVEVLRLLVREPLRPRQIAGRARASPPQRSTHHIAHIYDKAGVVHPRRRRRLRHGARPHPPRPGHLTGRDRRGLTLLSMLAADGFKLLLLPPSGSCRDRTIHTGPIRSQDAPSRSNSSRPGALGRPPGSICSPTRRLSCSSDSRGQQEGKPL